MHRLAALAVLAVPLLAAARPSPMPKDPPAVAVTRAFFAAFGRGDLEAVAATFHPDCTLTAVRAGERRDGELYGTYVGPAGVRDFLATMGRTLDTRAFTVEHVVGDGEVAFASGTFLHLVRATGKPFASAWALQVRVREGRIVAYTFYEDSAAFVAASQP